MSESDVKPGTVVRGFSRFPWFHEYTLLRARDMGGWKLSWRQAVWVAWKTVPRHLRDPKTQLDLAQQVLGLKTSHAISKWRRIHPELDDLVAERAAEAVFKHREDVLQALVASASDPSPRAHADRRLFLEMTGDYSPRASVSVQADITRHTDEFERMDDDALDQYIANATAALATG